MIHRQDTWLLENMVYIEVNSSDNFFLKTGRVAQIQKGLNLAYYMYGNSSMDFWSYVDKIVPEFHKQASWQKIKPSCGCL